jgi:hypothetical protein
MAAGAWTFYFEAKKYLMDGSIDLNTNVFRMTLHTSANTYDGTKSVYNASISGTEVANGNGYATNGQALTGVTWTAGANASTFRFNANSLVWTATGGNIANIKSAIIWISAAATANRKLLCRSQLTTAQFTLNQNNTLTIAPSATGIFNLV